MPARPEQKRALISTSDKTGLVEFAKHLKTLDFEILATGGTARLLSQNNIPITEVADYTGFPEMMGGRIKTLHPKIHAGILGRQSIDEADMAAHDIGFIHLVAVNLYPFAQTIANPNCQFADAIENIDIGGPTMLRSAAKNHEYVTVIVDPNDYQNVIDEIKTQGDTQLATRRMLAYKTFQHTAQYDTLIADYLAKQQLLETAVDAFPNTLTLTMQRAAKLRYGENPHQNAAAYQTSAPVPGSLVAAKVLQGKALSYNNLVDSEAALACVREFTADQPACIIVKHATPCGVGQGSDLLGAYEKALATDPQSAFGGIIAFNQPLDAKTAENIISRQFVEVIIAPDITPEAQPVLAQKNNLRVLAVGYPHSNGQSNKQLRSISGGLLLQDMDQLVLDASQFTCVTDRQPTTNELNDLLFSWKVVKHIKSNAIVYGKDGATLGIGSGQTSRVFSAKIAILKAQEASLSLTGAVMASDAFFPFPDTLEVAAAAGITAVIQPGGSKRDPEVIAAANALNLAMLCTGKRHFLH